MAKVNRKGRRKARALGWLAGLAAAGLSVTLLCRDGGVSHSCLAGGVLAVVILAAAHRWFRYVGGVPILVYHSVSDRSDWLPWAQELSVTTATLKCHLETIRKAGYHVLPASEIVRYLQTGIDLPDKPLAIHLDDGYLDNWVAAVPLLERAGMPATIFVSLDFIESGETLRPTIDDVEAGRCSTDDICWEGYMNWAELRALQSSPLIDIEPHGIDHGRVITGPRILDCLSEENWRRHIWMQWATMPGDKSGWHRLEAPPICGFGSPIGESGSALACRAWSEGELEPLDSYLTRVRIALRRPREVLARELGGKIEVFCWPYNEASESARQIARELGYLATTGGQGENRLGENPEVLSRLHVGDRAAGWSSAWLEALALKASIRTFHGIYYWYFLVLVFNVSRRLILGARAYWSRVTS